MPAWPGGSCPSCGENVPANVIHCQYCRALLNTDLEPDSVEIPEFIPLQEISSMVEVEVLGYYLTCPVCKKELRIGKKYVGQRVSCNLCKAQFPLELSNAAIEQNGFYANCPHCEKELRAAPKYLGERLTCKLCGGLLHFADGGN